MQRTRPVNAELVEFHCDCGGVFRVANTVTVIHSNPKQWRHVCNRCETVTHLAYPFPLVRINGREFVLAEHVRFEGNDFIGSR